MALKMREGLELNGNKILLTDKQAAGLKLLTSSKKYIKFWGGARSGKTFLICLYILRRALKYKNSFHIILRYSKAAAKNTVWRQELLPLLKIAEEAKWCKIYHTECYAEFINGSWVGIGGIQPAEIDKILSSQYQSIFINEANENNFRIIELLMTRLNGTPKDKTGKVIDLKFCIDLNPTLQTSWTRKVFLQGINPEDNKPIANYDLYGNLHFIPYDNIEYISKDYIAQLESMSETKKLRFLKGEYGSFEGLVYNLDESNIVDDFQIPSHWDKWISIDFGYVHPFVALYFTENDENIYLYREYVQCQVTIPNHIKQLYEFHEIDLTYQDDSINETYRAIVCDHDAGDRAQMDEAGISTKPANKKVDYGIDKVIDYLERGKLKIFRSCINTINGFNSYRWKERPDGMGRDREVLKIDDDEMDALRYAVCEIAGLPSQSETVYTTSYF